MWLAATLALAVRDTNERAARSEDSEQRPEAQDGTDQYPRADHGKSQLDGRVINTSHKQSFQKGKRGTIRRRARMVGPFGTASTKPVNTLRCFGEWLRDGGTCLVFR